MRWIIALAVFSAATIFAQPPATKPGNDIAALRKMADEFYAWRNENFPVFSSEAGLHTWDNRLTDYAPAKISERNQRVRKLLDHVRAMPAAKWAKDDRIDWLLFRAQLEGSDFNNRILQPETRDPQLYVGECS